MYRFFLDSTEVEEPESFTNISFEKKRDEKYFGFILRKQALVKVLGAGQVKFTQEKAVAILKSAKKRFGYAAQVSFEVYFQEKLAYQGLVNLWNAEWRAETVVVTFTDGSNSVKFQTNSNNKFQVSTNKFQTLTSEGFVGKTTHQILDTLNIFRQKTSTDLPFSHSIPFQAVSGSSNSTVGVIKDFNSIAPVYTNDSERKHISVRGTVYVNAKADSTVGVYVNEILTNTYPLTTTATNFVFVIDETFILQPYEEVIIKVVSNVNADDITFIYDTNYSVLSINEIKENVVPTDVPCISSFDFLNSLVQKASDNTIVLQSSFLSKLPHDWTNGRNLRGVPSILNASFNQVFEELNKMYCLTCEVRNDKIIIEQRKNILKNGTVSYLNRDKILSEVETPNRDFLFSTIKVGFKNWKGDSSLSNQEVNSLYQFGTNIFGRELTLDLECDSIASGILIEEIRQSQFGKTSTEQNKKFDDSLVCLIANSSAKNFINFNLNSDCRNLTIRPLQMLRNWAEVLGGYLYFNFLSGVGNYDALINNEKQNITIASFGNILSDKFFDLQYECELWEYENIGDVIYWVDTLGNNKKGILIEAQWSNGTMILTLIEA